MMTVPLVRNALGFLASAAFLSACTSLDVPPTEATCTNELQEGWPLEGWPFYGSRVIVACNLNPDSELIDVVGERVFTMSPRGGFFVSSHQSSDPALMYRSGAFSPGENRTATYFDGEIVFDGSIGSGADRAAGMITFPASPAASARLLSEADGYLPGGRVLDSGSLRYVSQNGGDAILELEVQTGRTRRLVGGTPIGLSDNWVYYCRSGAVHRIRKDGTQAQAIADASVPAPHCDAEILAADESGVFLTRQDAPYEIWHFGPEGEQERVANTSQGTDEIRLPPPTQLFAAGGWIYVLRRGSGLDMLSRVSIGTEAEEEFLVESSRLGRPLFRGDYLYVVVTRDGLDGPVDGVVLRIDLTPP